MVLSGFKYGNTTGRPSPRSESGRPSSGVLLGDDLGAGRHETHAGVVIVRDDGFDAVVDEVEGADEDVGGGKVGGEVELLAVSGRDPVVSVR